MESKNIYGQVQEYYGSVARAKNPTYSSAIAQAFGYTEEELNSIPRDANLGLSCGNPLAIASLREGETVIDLGSGAGFDVFLAAKKVGVEGHVFGVDRNKDMLALARSNQTKSIETNNISFIESNITSIPLEDGIADCIISNCVINLVPEADKPTVFAEMGRLIKSGGRVAISDILARKTLPAKVRESVALYVGCIAGASRKEDYTQFLKDGGFRDIAIIDTESDLNVYIYMAKNEADVKSDACCSREKKGAECCSKAIDDTTTCCETGCCSVIGSKQPDSISTDFKLTDIDINIWAGSFKIFAVKV